MSASTAFRSANSRRRPSAASDMKERIDMNERKERIDMNERKERIDMNENLGHSSQLPNSNEKSPKPGWMTLLRYYLLWFIVLVVLVRIIMEGRMARLESRVDELNTRIGDLELLLNELKSKGLLTKYDVMNMYGELKRIDNPFAGLSYDEIRHSVKDDALTMFRDMMGIVANFTVEG